MELFCIINLRCLETAIGGHRLSKHYGPTCFYDDIEDAYEELFRLQKRFPQGQFYVFKTLAVASESAVTPGVYHIAPASAREY